MLRTHPATAEPAGTESGTLGVIVGLTMTVPSTNGANPGRNLLVIEHGYELKSARDFSTLLPLELPQKKMFHRNSDFCFTFQN